MYLRCWLSNIPDFLLEFHRNVFTQDQTAFKSALNLWSRTQVSRSRIWPSFVSWSNLAHNKRFSSSSMQPGLKLWNFQQNLSSFVFETLCWSTKCICPCPCVPSPKLSCQKTDLTKCLHLKFSAAVTLMLTYFSCQSHEVCHALKENKWGSHSPRK